MSKFYSQLIYIRVVVRDVTLCSVSIFPIIQLGSSSSDYKTYQEKLKKRMKKEIDKQCKLKFSFVDSISDLKVFYGLASFFFV